MTLNFFFQAVSAIKSKTKLLVDITLFTWHLLWRIRDEFVDFRLRRKFNSKLPLEERRKAFQAITNRIIEQRKKRQAKHPPPCYDEIYHKGVEWLDSL
jgi:hypothetical protein